MKNGDKPINPLKRANNAFYDEKDESFINRIKPLIGLTKIEYFSVLAMQGLLANPQYWKRVYKDISTLKSDKDSIECVFAHYSIKIAEELLEQLENK